MKCPNCDNKVFFQIIKYDIEEKRYKLVAMTEDKRTFDQWLEISQILHEANKQNIGKWLKDDRI